MSDNGRVSWTTERRRLSDLKPWPRNPRQITGDQAKRLVDSFTEFGQVETIAIGPDNDIYNGHQRLFVLEEQNFPRAFCSKSFKESEQACDNFSNPAMLSSSMNLK